VNNKAAIAVVIVIILVLGGFFLLQKNKPSMKSTSNTSPTVAVKPTQANAFTSIKDAISKSISLKCEYPNPKDSSVKTTTYIKNGHVRVIASTKNDVENVIIKDNKSYSWREGTKTGVLMTFDIEAMKETAEKMKATISPSEKQPDQKEAMMKQIEQYKNSCKQENVADSFFEVPADVKFTDYSEMMKKTMDQSGMKQEDVQKMMEQYKQPAQ